jgi:hypothetical protein
VRSADDLSAGPSGLDAGAQLVGDGSKVARLCAVLVTLTLCLAFGFLLWYVAFSPQPLAAAATRPESPVLVVTIGGQRPATATAIDPPGTASTQDPFAGEPPLAGQAPSAGQATSSVGQPPAAGQAPRTGQAPAAAQSPRSTRPGSLSPSGLQ